MTTNQYPGLTSGQNNGDDAHVSRNAWKHVRVEINGTQVKVSIPSGYKLISMAEAGEIEGQLQSLQMRYAQKEARLQDDVRLWKSRAERGHDLVKQLRGEVHYLTTERKYLKQAIVWPLRLFWRSLWKRAWTADKAAKVEMEGNIKISLAASEVLSRLNADAVRLAARSGAQSVIIPSPSEKWTLREEDLKPNVYPCHPEGKVKP